LSEESTEATGNPFRRKDVLLVAVLLVGITVAFFLPLVLRIGSSLLEPNFGGPAVVQQSRDKFHFIWNFWWLRHALSAHLGVLQTQLIFYPQGASLVLQTMDYFDGAVAAPLAMAFGEVFSYNAVLLASFPLAGVSAYLLAWHLTRSRLASLVGGVIFALFPQHVAQALFGHPNIANVAWIPAYFLCLMLAFEKGKARYAVAAGGMLAILTMVDLQQLLMAAIGTVTYLGYHLAATRLSHPLRILGLTFLVAAVAVVFTSPYLYFAFQAVSSQSRPPPPITDAIKGSANPLLYLTPFPYSAVSGALFAHTYHGLAGTPSNWIIFIGWTVLALAVVGAITSSDRRKYFLIALAAVSLLFSLGPTQDPSAISLRSPYTFLYDHISILHYFRASARLSILLMLAMSGLAAMGASKMMKVVEGKRVLRFPATKVVACVLLALIVVEYAPSVAVEPVPQSGAYGIISSDNGNFSVLELPATLTQTQRALYAQTIDGKPLVNGKLSQSAQTVPSYVYSQPFLSSLVEPLKSSKVHGDIVNQSFTDSQLAPIVMTEYGIKYVVVNVHGYANPAAYHRTYMKLHRALGLPVYQDQSTVLFELGHWATTSSILNMIGTSPLVVFGAGWGAPGSGGRQASAKAEAFIYVSTAGYYDLEMASSGKGTCLTVNASSPAACGALDPGTGLWLYRLPLAAGRNVVDVVTPSDDPLVSYMQVTPEQGGSK
jgi:hypothetical protein